MVRKMVEEADWKDLYRAPFEEARQADARGVSDVYLTGSEGHHNVNG
jgi:hypothetical protein